MCGPGTAGPMTRITSRQPGRRDSSSRVSRDALCKSFVRVGSPQNIDILCQKSLPREPIILPLDARENLKLSFYVRDQIDF